MTVNGIDARKFDAKQLTVDVQPPTIASKYEWVTGALIPTQFKTDVTMGHLKLCVYFRGKDRNTIIRRMSEFMANFTSVCDLKLDGYKGTYRGQLTSDDYEKTIEKRRYKLDLEFDGYFYDDEITVVFDGAASGVFHMIGSRRTPCILEVCAKETLENYTISGLGDDDIVIQRIEAGETIIIDGVKGLVTVSETRENAFGRVDLWEFPSLRRGETMLRLSSDKAKVTIRYNPMWI